MPLGHDNPCEPFRKTSASTVSSPRRLRFFVTTLPAKEKTRSDAADDGGNHQVHDCQPSQRWERELVAAPPLQLILCCLFSKGVKALLNNKAPKLQLCRLHA